MIQPGKIIYVHTCEWPSRSPSVVFTTGTSLGIAAHNPCELIVRNGSDKPSDEIFRSITGEAIPSNLEINRIGMGDRTPGHTSFFIKAANHIRKQVQNNEAGSVITRSIGFLPYLVGLKKFAKIPVFFETHDFFGDLSLRTDLKKNLTVLKKSILEKRFLPFVDGIICLTETQAEFFRKYYPDTPVQVAKTGLFKVSQINSHPEGKTICYSGSLDAHKGLGTVLKALSMVTDKKIKLLIIGGKDEREKNEFMSLANMIGVSDKITILGWVHHSDIGHLMAKSSAGIAPLRNTPFNACFTSPLKILDYISYSLPVICSDLPPVREYIRDGVHGLLFKPDDPESLANSLDIFFSGGLYEKMADAVNLLGQDLLWSKRGEIITNFIGNFKKQST